MIAEYFLGFLVAIVMLVLLRFLIPRTIRNNPINKIRYSQSHIHDITKYYLPDSLFMPIKKPRQSANHEKSINLKVLFFEKEAYWIKGNTLFIAEQEDGIVKEETARGVDTMGMNRVQLEKVMYIVDILNEGNQNDSGYTRNNGF
jgi:hypothetical protein